MTNAFTAGFTDRLASIVRKGISAFKRARSGNVALIFAVAIIPVVVTGAAGIDLARALAVRSKMYAAVDAAALAVASKYSSAAMTDAQADDLANKFFRANYKLSAGFGAPTDADATIDSTSRSVVVTSNTAVPTTLMNIAGIRYVNLTASSNVVWGQTKIWVGLALDNTGSMCQSDTNTSATSCSTQTAGMKITALKTATKSLLTMFQTAAANPGDVRVSLVPFNRDVNVGTGNSSATWLDWTAWDETRGSCSASGYTTKSSCLAAGSCSISGNTTQATCQAASVGSCSNANFNSSQNSCSNAGSCNIGNGSYTTQSACTSAGSCSISGKTTYNSCGTCTITGNNSQNSCTGDFANVCKVSGVVQTGSAYDTKSECKAAGVCSIAGYTTKSNCNNAYNGYVCRINGTNYPNDARFDTQSECTANTTGGLCSKNPTTNNTKSKCNNANGTWYPGSWIGINGSGVWTAGVWSQEYGVWTPGTWTYGQWTSQPGTWTINYGVWTSANAVWTPNRSAWTGCVADRGDAGAPSSPAYDTLNTSPISGVTASQFPTESYSDCPVSMMPLSYQWTDLSNKVDAMVAKGNTNQTIGLAWAWHSLSQGDPLNPGALPSNTIRHIIILSDGENTQNRWSSTRSTIDARMATLCQNAKNDNVIIWTVFVNIAGTAGNASSMKNCASGGEFGGKYIEVTSAGGIGTAFNAIGQQITNLRVAH